MAYPTRAAILFEFLANLRDGEHERSAAQLADALGWSRRSVNEALQQLKRKGLVECVTLSPLWSILPGSTSPEDTRGRWKRKKSQKIASSGT